MRVELENAKFHIVLREIENELDSFRNFQLVIAFCMCAECGKGNDAKKPVPVKSGEMYGDCIFALFGIRKVDTEENNFVLGGDDWDQWSRRHCLTHKIKSINNKSSWVTTHFGCLNCQKTLKDLLLEADDPSTRGRLPMGLAEFVRSQDVMIYFDSENAFDHSKRYGLDDVKQLAEAAEEDELKKRLSDVFADRAEHHVNLDSKIEESLPRVFCPLRRNLEYRVYFIAPDKFSDVQFVDHEVPEPAHQSHSRVVQFLDEISNENQTDENHSERNDYRLVRTKLSFLRTVSDLKDNFKFAIVGSDGADDETLAALNASNNTVVYRELQPYEPSHFAKIIQELKSEKDIGCPFSIFATLNRQPLQIVNTELVGEKTIIVEFGIPVDIRGALGNVAFEFDTLGLQRITHTFSTFSLAEDTKKVMVEFNFKNSNIDYGKVRRNVQIRTLPRKDVIWTPIGNGVTQTKGFAFDGDIVLPAGEGADFSW